MTNFAPQAGQSDSFVSRLGALLTLALATTVALWLGWFVMHLPATVRLFPPTVAGPILLLLQLTTLTVLGRLVDAPSTWAASLLVARAGLLSAAMSLIVIGSNLAPKAASTEELAGSSWAPTPGTALMAAGWLALGAVTGLLAGGLSRLGRSQPGRISAPATPQQWLSRLVIAALGAAFPLMIAGGLVTSSQSGMAVPDWPGTYGANMFLYPVALMADPRIFLEHTHRLLGALVGLGVLLTTGYALLVDRRSGVRWLAVGLLVLVIGQGLLGALRVVENRLTLGFIHGVVAQVFFGGLAVLAVVVRPSARPGEGPWQMLPARVRTLHAVLLGALLVQLTLGALSRHLGSGHAMWTHAAFSLVAVTLVAVAGSGWMGRARRGELPAHAATGLRRLGVALHGVVGVQFLLGFAALWAVLAYDPRPEAIPTYDQLDETPVMALLPTVVRTLHQANGALLVGLAAASAAWAWLLSRPGARPNT